MQLKDAGMDLSTLEAGSNTVWESKSEEKKRVYANREIIFRTAYDTGFVDPYPVLASFNDDYKSSKFHVNAECVLDGFDICINYSVELENDQIRELISKGKASLVFHLESVRTGYREARETDRFNGKIVLKDSQLNGDLSFCPFIIAKEDIADYFNNDFNEDYTEPVFLGKGYLIAVGNQMIWPINKNNVDLLNSSSPFKIGLNPDESVSNMVVDFESSPKIRILLSSKDLSCYKNMNNTPELKAILNRCYSFDTSYGIFP